MMEHCDCRALEKKIFEDFVLTHNPKEADTDNDEDNMLELLELYMDMVEKQDEIIYRLGKIVARQATDIQLLKNDRNFRTINWRRIQQL